MNKKIFTFLTLIFSALTFSFAAPTDEADAKSVLESESKRLSYLSIQCLLYDRDKTLEQAEYPDDEEIFTNTLRRLEAKNFTNESLIELLKHEDAKVRTLAAAVLFCKEDPSVLPAIFELHKDNAPTFDGHPYLSKSWLKYSGISPAQKEQTVAYVVDKMLDLYMAPAGYYNGAKDFPEYWKTHKNRKYCASWFCVKFLRATHARKSMSERDTSKLKALRDEIKKLLPDDRAWILLWIEDRVNLYMLSDTSKIKIASEDEMISLCKYLGPKKLMLMLQKKIPSDDPDLQARPSNNWAYKRMQDFVLNNSDKLLRPADSNALIECEIQERNYKNGKIIDPNITPLWAIAAAKLEPKKTSEILRAALERFNGKYDFEQRIEICITLCKVCGKSEIGLMCDRFFEQPSDRSLHSSYTLKFIEEISKTKNAKALLNAIANDTRLNSLDWQSLEKLIRVMNSYQKKTIVSDSEFINAWHPIGKANYYMYKENALKEYPKETEALEDIFADWRNRLRRAASR